MERLHEDFGDEPAVEERMPFGLAPEEMREITAEASLDACEICGERFPQGELIETGMYEYCTMDIDPGALICCDCLEARTLRFIPADPSHFDCYTPVDFV